MSNMTDPTTYEAWYQTRRGRWIADREFSLIQRLLSPASNTTLLDVGCGTGHFTRRFAKLGQSVTGIDPDENALDYAKRINGGITYLQGSALNLPFQTDSYDYTTAITSLCFITDPIQALHEMWRVSRHGLVLGLLNRHSILHRMKQGQGGYRNARWDTARVVHEKWLTTLVPAPTAIHIRSAIFLPQGNMMAKWIESLLPDYLPWGGFLVVHLQKQASDPLGLSHT